MPVEAPQRAQISPVVGSEVLRPKTVLIRRDGALINQALVRAVLDPAAAVPSIDQADAACAEVFKSWLVALDRIWHEDGVTKYPVANTYLELTDRIQRRLDFGACLRETMGELLPGLSVFETNVAWLPVGQRSFMMVRSGLSNTVGSIVTLPRLSVCTIQRKLTGRDVASNSLSSEWSIQVSKRRPAADTNDAFDEANTQTLDDLMGQFRGDGVTLRGERETDTQGLIYGGFTGTIFLPPNSSGLTASS